MASATISIGRGVGREGELSDQSWHTFKFRVRRIASEYGTLVFEGEGNGVYDGRSETAYTITIADIKEEIHLMYLDLEVERQNFGQEAIAVTIGNTNFVHADSQVSVST